MSKELLQQALDALLNSTPKPTANADDYCERGWKEREDAITALRSALAAPPAAPAPAVLDGAHTAMLEALNQATSAEYWAPLGSTCKQHAKAAREAIQAALSAAPAVREPQDERAAFEAWARSQDLQSGYDGTFDYPLGNILWKTWQARAAHGITGGGK